MHLLPGGAVNWRHLSSDAALPVPISVPVVRPFDALTEHFDHSSPFGGHHWV